MKKSDREEMDFLKRDNDRLLNDLDAAKERILLLEEELSHYKVAVSAVRWLWAQAEKQPEFQL